MDEPKQDNSACRSGSALEPAVGRPEPERETLAGVIARMEREAFEKWLMDYLGPLTTNVEKSAMWAAWQARGALRVPCRGVTRNGCAYLAPCGSICNKCGHEH
jgi:hypothetical protein